MLAVLSLGNFILQLMRIHTLEGIRVRTLVTKISDVTYMTKKRGNLGATGIVVVM